jgi:serine/threonine protein kinase
VTDPHLLADSLEK